MPRRTVLDPAEMRVRLIQPSDASNPRARQILGRWYAPAHERALNGRGGFASGRYQRRRDEEGDFTLRLPQGVHRDRFLLLTDDLYASGDEFLEIRRGNDLELVGTPISYGSDPAAVELSGPDAWALLKATRETTAAKWHHAPRDVIEHYTRVWVPKVAAAFDEAADPLEWRTEGASFNPAKPGAVRLTAQAGGEPAVVVGLDGVSDGFGDGATDPHAAWRFECRFSRTLLHADARVLVGLFLDNTGQGSPMAALSILGTDILVYGPQAGTTWLTAAKDTDPPGPFHVAIEGRHPWIYYWLDGELLGIQPMSTQTGEHYMRPGVILDPAEAGPASDVMTVDVEHVIARRAEPFLLRGADKGDYHLPGLPVRGGLDGSFFNEASTYSDAALASVREKHLLKPTLEPAARRQDETLAAHGTSWAPAGLTTQFSARWVGAIWLDLAAYDYKLRAYADDRVRVWVGKTRFGEQVIDDWTNAGHAMTYTESAGLRASLGLVTGWYPIVVEYSNGENAGGIQLEVARQDQPRAWWLVNGGSYRLEPFADSPAAYWPLGDLLEPLRDYSPNPAPDATVFVGSLASFSEGPIPGHRAYNFDGVDDSVVAPSSAKLNPTPALTVEAWIYPDVLTGLRSVVRKEGQYILRQNGATVEGVLWVAGVPYTFASTGVLVVGEWQYIAVTWTDTTDVVKLYRNGVEVASGTRAGPLSTTNNALRIGSYNDVGEFFDGGIAEVAVYGAALSAARVAAHYAAKDQIAAGFTSPQGCYQAQVQKDSHYEQIAAILADTGLQATLEPRPLESGEFPGQLIPRVRVGRDTNKKIGADGAVSPQAQGSAEERADSLIVDGQGLGTEGAQITAERINFGQAKAHLFLHQDYDSESDITIPSLLEQRTDAKLALKSVVFEEIGLQPEGQDELLDSYPLTGVRAKGPWNVGDGVFLDRPDIGVIDTEPRALMGIEWPFVPDGRGGPNAAFRQRPRNFKRALREMKRTQLTQIRNYQLQRAIATGSPGRHPAPTAAGAITDNYSRLNLPDSLPAATGLFFVVQNKSDASTMNIEVNGTNRATFTAVGRFDLTSWIARSGGEPRMYARATGGTGTAEYALELITVI